MKNLGKVMILACRYAFERNTGATNIILEFLKEQIYLINDWQALVIILRDANDVLENYSDIDRNSIHEIILLVEEKIKKDKEQANEIWEQIQ